MKERAQELKSAARRGGRSAKADGESELLAKLAEMAEPDRVLGERLHAIITAQRPRPHAEALVRDARLRRGGKVVCFTARAGARSGTRPSASGDQANLDEGAMWPTSFALPELTADAEARIAELVKKAVRLITGERSRPGR